MAVDNQEIAELLEEIAAALRETGGNEYKTRAYERAASAIVDADQSVAELHSERGEAGIRTISGIGEGIAKVISEYLETGRSRLLDDLLANVNPADLFAEIPGLGDELAGRVSSSLEISTLEELEEAAHDGRLEEVEGLGPDRVRAVRDHLAQRLGRGTGAGRNPSAQLQPPTDLLLEIDREYREKASAGELRTIAPRRFNPEGTAWLPVLETEREGWKFTALFSNTAHAHEQGKTHDWVVVYYERDGKEGQSTVITAGPGPHKGERIVAG
ncbi:MAG: helix-hairpin-helix domain-containing protein [Spirochaetota bacterium]